MITRAYCGGTYDLLHPGHIRFFKWVHDNFDGVTVALNTDNFVRKYKCKPPVQSFDERREMIESCRYVDQVVVNVGDEDSKPSILVVRPTHIVNGSDWSNERLMRQMGLTTEFLGEHGLSIVLCPLVREFSTTEMKVRVKCH